MQPHLPDGSVPGTQPYVPANAPPPGYLQPARPVAPQSNLTIAALGASLLLCFGYPVVIVLTTFSMSDKGASLDALIWLLLGGAVLVLGSFILAIIALASIRRSAGRTAMGIAAIVFTILAPVTSLITAAGCVLLMGGGGVHGRPLRRRNGRPVVTPGAESEAWTAPGESPSQDGLDPATRAALARAWSEDAALEHASIAAFGKLALDLVAVGAPPDLLAGAHRAALEEVEHARIAYSFASAYAGVPCGAGELPAAAEMPGGESRGERIARVVFESVVDGMVGESAAARIAADVAARTVDPVVARALVRIAREEATHAALGGEVVAWCVARDRGAAERGIERALRELQTLVDGPRRRVEEARLPGRATTHDLDEIRRSEAASVLALLASASRCGEDVCGIVDRARLDPPSDQQAA